LGCTSVDVPLGLGNGEDVVSNAYSSALIDPPDFVLAIAIKESPSNDVKVVI
jgi:hypothetical protein